MRIQAKLDYKNITKLFLLVLIIFVPFYASCQNTVTWETKDEILARIVPPTFPDREFDVTKYGAKGDSITDCTSAFAQAIEACSKSGGGKVIVPAGVYLTGAIHLKSNVNFVLSKGTILRFSTDPKKYSPLVFTRWEGVECMNYSALIYAYGQENIAVTGEGILDGQGSEKSWWSWKGNKQGGWKEGMPNQNAARKKLIAMMDQNIPPEQRVFGEGSYLRPNFIQLYKCKNILLDGFTLLNSPMWVLHPVLSSNITISNITVEGLGPNGDGCDPESCKDVLIKNCTFNTGDDCIAIKSGRNADGRRVNVPTENVVIQNCKMKEGHGGVVIGSEISGGVRNVFVEDCIMDSPNLDRALRFKTNSVRGGVLENFFARKIKVGQVAEAVIKVDFYYEEGDAGSFTPTLRNIFVNDLSCEKGQFAIWIRAYERSPVENIHLKNCTFNGIMKNNVIENVKNFSAESVTINNKPFIVN